MINNAHKHHPHQRHTTHVFREKSRALDKFQTFSLLILKATNNAIYPARAPLRKRLKRLLKRERESERERVSSRLFLVVTLHIKHSSHKRKNKSKMPKEKKIIGTGVKQKALTAEEKKRKEEKEKREKERERKERKARDAVDRTFGLKNKNVSSKVQTQIARNVAQAPSHLTPVARRAQAEARAREKKKTKEAEMQAKRELDVLMGVISDVSLKREDEEEDEEDSPKSKQELDAREEEKRRKIEEKQRLLKELERKQAEMQRQEIMSSSGVKLKPGDEGYDPYEDYPDENILGGDFEDEEERERLFKRLTKAVCGIGKKGEVRDAVGEILKTIEDDDDEDNDDDA